MTEPDFPKLTAEQKAYVAGWHDPDEARRRRIEALVEIVDGLHPWVYTIGVVDTVTVVVDGWRQCIYCCALRKAKSRLLWELAWASALDGAHYFDECGDRIDVIVRLKTDGPDPWVETEGHHGCELTTFVDMIECYVGLPGTRLYGEDALVELARDWLVRTAPAD
jgi:hypothetical protein